MGDLLQGLRCELTLRLRFGEWEWRYQVEGRLGACEFWCRKRSTHVMEVLGPGERLHYGGFETHSATPSPHHGAPDHARCSALSDRACWHDGSSTYAEEFWVPRWERNPNDHEDIFRSLAAEYRKRFETKDED